MNLVIETIPFSRIVYIRNIGPYGPNNNKTMENLKLWANANGLLHDQSVILGIAQDNPQFVEPNNCRYDACLVLTKECNISNYIAPDCSTSDSAINEFSIKEGSLPSGKYAVFKIAHTKEAVEDAWHSIFPELYKQSYEVDQARPILERYRFELVKKHYCELCVPIL